MSRSELTDAYVSGRIHRRAFVRGMVALGASVPVAMALADKVWADNHGPRRTLANDIYPDPYPWSPTSRLAKRHVSPQAEVLAITDQDKSTVVVPLAAGAAAAALVALRMRAKGRGHQNMLPEDDQGEE